MKTINVLAIDDSRLSLHSLERLSIGSDIRVVGFLESRMALKVLEQKKMDLVLVDYIMPIENGIQVIEKIRTFDTEIPIILITGMEHAEDIKIEALKRGATDFWSKSSSLEELRIRVTNLGTLKQYREAAKKQMLTLEVEIDRVVKVIKTREHETLDVLMKMAKYKDHDTGKHIERVGEYARLIAKAIGMDEVHQDSIYYGAQLHDVGKIGIGDKILLKPGRLSSDEYEDIKRHAEIGYHLLEAYESPYLRIGGLISFTHHERFDGTGYPQKLSGESIPLEGRIVAIADTFDALVMKRVYKDKWEFEQALQYLESEKGKSFDKTLIDHFLAKEEEVAHIYRCFQEQEL